jgi:hypothetical protein
MLTSEIDDKEDADAASDAYVEKINKLLFRAIVSGNVVSPKGLGHVRSLMDSDTRIVWTNDRSADGELVQDFGNLLKCTTLFRGTVEAKEIITQMSNGRCCKGILWISCGHSSINRI